MVHHGAEPAVIGGPRGATSFINAISSSDLRSAGSARTAATTPATTIRLAPNR